MHYKKTVFSSILCHVHWGEFTYRRVNITLGLCTHISVCIDWRSTILWAWSKGHKRSCAVVENGRCMTRLTRTQCNTLPHTATHCNAHMSNIDIWKTRDTTNRKLELHLWFFLLYRGACVASVCCSVAAVLQCIPTKSHTAQFEHTATNCNTLQHTVTHTCLA